MTEPTNDQLVMLLALTRKNKHVYEGTVTPAEKSRRRARNKVARHSRRINRSN